MSTKVISKSHDAVAANIRQELLLPADRGEGLNPPEVICAANEARFTTATFNEPLTSMMIGWREPEDLETLLDRWFPIVEVGRRFEFKRAINAEAFLSESDDVRAIGSSFKRVEYSGETVTERTLNKGLTIRIDHDEAHPDDWRERAVRRLRERLLRNEIRRNLALIDAAATNAGKTWNDASNPDGDIREMLRLGADARGIRSNVVLYSEPSADLRLDVYEAQNTPYAGRAAGMSLGELARKYMVDLVDIVKARYQSTLTAKAGVMTANTVLSYLAESGASTDDPTNIKRFVSAARGGGRWGVYVVDHEKFTDISVEHYSAGIVTSTLGVRKITTSDS